MVPQFAFARPFSEGVAAVRKGDLSGYLRPDGSEALPFRYLSAGEFETGLAEVRTETASPPRRDAPPARPRDGGEAAVPAPHARQAQIRLPGRPPRLPRGGALRGDVRRGAGALKADPDGHAFFSAGLDCVSIGGDANLEGIRSLAGNPDPASAGWIGGSKGCGFLRGLRGGGDSTRATGETQPVAKQGEAKGS